MKKYIKASVDTDGKIEVEGNSRDGACPYFHKETCMNPHSQFYGYSLYKDDCAMCALDEAKGENDK